jgi:hypothetical protein
MGGFFREIAAAPLLADAAAPNGTPARGAARTDPIRVLREERCRFET